MRRRRLAVLVPLFAILAATVLAAAPAAAGGGCHAPATEARGTTVALADLCFSPTVLRVAPGTEVTFVNRDTITHPLSRPGGDWYWDGEGGTRSTVRLDEAGTYPFFCYAHPGMVGVVVVGDGKGPPRPAPGPRRPGPGRRPSRPRPAAACPSSPRPGWSWSPWPAWSGSSPGPAWRAAPANPSPGPGAAPGGRPAPPGGGSGRR